MKAILLLALGALCVQAFAADNWPQFRGPNASGVSTNTNLPDKFRRALDTSAFSGPVKRWILRLFDPM